MQTLEELARDLERRQRERRLAAHSRPWLPAMTPVTDLGYECERRAVYHQTRAEKASGIGEELASIFEEGNLHQKDVRAELAALGFEVVESESPFRDIGLQITGKIDGKIEVANPNGGRPRRVAIEIKSTQGGGPRTADEWRTHETPILRRYYAQLQTYLFLSSEPEGLGIFKSKPTGLWTVCPCPIDLEYCEMLVQRAERIRDAVRDVREGGDDFMPDRLASRAECPGCPFKDTVCFPEQAAVDPLLLAHDEVLAAQVERRVALDGPRREFEKLDEEIKTRFKLTLGERFVVGGKWLVRKRPHGKGVRVEIGPMPADGGDAA